MDVLSLKKNLERKRCINTFCVGLYCVRFLRKRTSIKYGHRETDKIKFTLKIEDTERCICNYKKGNTMQIVEIKIQFS